MRARTPIRALEHALPILVFEIAFARVLEFVEPGTRAQATGVALATLLALVSGFVLGLRERRRPASRAEDSEGMTPWDPAPWSPIVATTLGVGVFGALFYFTETELGLLSSSSVGVGGMARAMFGANASLLPSVIAMGLGGVLGANARARSVQTALLGVAVLAGLAYLAWSLAGRLTYDATLAVAFAAGGVALATIVTGALVCIARRRLAMVELALIAFVSGYAIFFVVALGSMEIVRSWTVPMEQVLLALSVLPTIALLAFLTVGGSIGFLAFGSGRFDPGAAVEMSIAMRYLAAHGRDGFVGVVTIIATVGVSLGVMALIIVLSVMSGFERDLEEKIVGAHAHVVVEKQGDDFTEFADVERQIAGVDGVRSAAAFVLGDAMISTEAGLSGTLVKGLDVRSESAIRDLSAGIESGSLDLLLHPERIPVERFRISVPPRLGSTESATTSERTRPHDAMSAPTSEAPTRRAVPGIVVGRELARTLRVDVGDIVKLVSPSSDEIGPVGPMPKLRRFRVAAIFYSGMYEYDAKFTYLDMAEAQRFFAKRGTVTGVEVRVHDIGDTARIVRDLSRAIGGYPYKARDWREMNKELFSALLLEKLAMFIVLAKTVLVASFLIVATLVMIVLQRGKEIAILKSIGASDASIMKIFVVQGLAIGVVGAALGVALGVGICALIGRYGVAMDPNIFYIERVPVAMDWAEVVAVAIEAMLIAYLATIYPAMTAAQLRPVQGLRED